MHCSWKKVANEALFGSLFGGFFYNNEAPLLVNLFHTVLFLGFWFIPLVSWRLVGEENGENPSFLFSFIISFLISLPIFCTKLFLWKCQQEMLLEENLEDRASVELNLMMGNQPDPSPSPHHTRVDVSEVALSENASDDLDLPVSSSAHSNSNEEEKEESHIPYYPELSDAVCDNQEEEKSPAQDESSSGDDELSEGEVTLPVITPSQEPLEEGEVLLVSHHLLEMEEKPVTGPAASPSSPSATLRRRAAPNLSPSPARAMARKEEANDAQGHSYNDDHSAGERGNAGEGVGGREGEGERGRGWEREREKGGEREGEREQ
eukprot:GCRY01006924.1.p1 GENE.GCRY01006924.1~~GCRY01006924.1.p1  ORF type:complete len:320 (+),score=47.17 GCRY01006924.1:192-1151(+)